MLRRWIVAITGASGTCYGRRLISALLEHEQSLEIDVVVSESALRVMREEEAADLATIGKPSVESLLGFPSNRVQIHSNKNIGATIASGSSEREGMVIVPCSMKTLAAVANGYCENLIQRAADVTLKEGRKLVIVPRETPLSAIHLENMLKLARIGVRVVPAMPGFYNKPVSIADLVDMMVMRIADQMGISLDIATRWDKSVSKSSK